MLLVDDLIEFSAVYSVEVLPLPVGPVTRIIPCAFAGTIAISRRFSRDSPSWSIGRIASVGVQQPDDDLLAELGRHRRDPKIDPPPLEPQPAAAVLRLAALGDVHPGHDLETGDRRVLQMVGNGQHVVQQPVDALPDLQQRLVRLDVDVAGAGFRGVAQDEVDELHDRRRDADPWRATQGRPARIPSRCRLDLPLRASRRRACRTSVRNRRRAPSTDTLKNEHLLDHCLRRDDGSNLSAGSKLDIRQQSWVQRITHGQRKTAAFQRESGIALRFRQKSGVRSPVTRASTAGFACRNSRCITSATSRATVDSSDKPRSARVFPSVAGDFDCASTARAQHSVLITALADQKAHRVTALGAGARSAARF